MTKEEAIQILSTRDAHGVLCGYTSGVTEALDMAIEALSKPTCKKCEDLEREVLDKIRAEIEQKIEQERFARSVFRGEEKDAVKAEQCTGSIFAYNNVIRFIDKYKTESEDKG